ncbi:MAG TPA: hypothetical protein VFM18_09700 [Methanosarcina sp.]|nr:hypothetical protein [Methanosarcina sp.]
MGMYTGFVFNIRLSAKTPQLVIKVLDYVLSGEEELAKEDPLLKAFDFDTFNDTAGRMLTCSSTSFNEWGTRHWKKLEDGTYWLLVAASSKQIYTTAQSFLDWLHPYFLDVNEYVGFCTYEETSAIRVFTAEEDKILMECLPADDSSHWLLKDRDMNEELAEIWTKGPESAYTAFSDLIGGLPKPDDTNWFGFGN